MLRRLALTGVFAAAAFAIFGAPALAAPAPVTVPVIVRGTAVLTDSGVQVHAGDAVTIHAAGRVRFSATVGDIGPEGIPWGKRCFELAKVKGATPWPAPGKPCWSLIGRVVGGPVFEVGRSATFTVKTSGRLLLGINDNYPRDNTGTWTAAVRTTSTAPSAAAPVSQAKPKNGGSLPVIVAGIGGFVAVALLLWWLLARRRRRPAEAPPLVMTPAVDPDAESVNIFAVDLVDGPALHVGYGYFPEGVAIDWSVEGAIGTGAGSFVTEGGTDAHHVTFPVDAGDGRGDVTTVRFRWEIDGVPFEYAVRRVAIATSSARS